MIDSLLSAAKKRAQFCQKYLNKVADRILIYSLHWITESKSKCDFFFQDDVFVSSVAKVVRDKRIQAIGTEIKEFLTFALLFFVRQSEFRLSNLEFSLAFQFYVTHTQVGTT
jgi:aryl-alcohol dehydrogenase-like predicted oxidoreductase